MGSAMTIKTINPYTEKTIDEFQEESLENIKTKISEIRRAQQKWKLNLDNRLQELKQVKKRMESDLTELSKLMSSEMGKPVAQSEAEVKKCIWLVDYMVENADTLLAPEYVKTEAKKSYIRFDPIGAACLFMPWNFPSWQVMRAAIPALTAGNAVLLKHASIVSGSSLRLQEIFGLDVFKSVVARGPVATEAIRYVDGVSFTGSTDVGSKIGETAGGGVEKKEVG